MGAPSVTSGVLIDTTFEAAAYRHALQRIRAEYLEMPGMKLTAQQVQRLAGVDGLVCTGVLEELVTSGLLCRDSGGTYRRS